MLLYLTVVGRRYLGGVLWRLSTATSGSERKRVKYGSMSHARTLIGKRKKVTLMVELDQMKTEILGYETPLAEVRDSL